MKPGGLKCLNSFMLFSTVWIEVGFDSGHVKQRRKTPKVITSSDIIGNTK